MNYLKGLVVFILMWFASASVAETSVVIVQGLAGEEYYQRHFDEQVEKIQQASSKLVAADKLTIFNDEATGADILSKLQEIIKSGDSDDLLLLYLIGHGSYDGRDYKFNIAGIDITGTQLFDLFLNSVPSIALINTSSSSGALLKLFEEAEHSSNVHLITATKSGAERTATRFGRHLADALVDSEADINKNQSISLQEAFDYAQRETQVFFDSEGLLATENSRLQMANSVQASQIRLVNLANRPVLAANSEITALYAQRDELDRQIDSLRLRRISMSEEDYLNQFQTLMVQLSILQSQIDAEVPTQ